MCRPEFSIIRLKNNSIYSKLDERIHSFVPVLMSLAAESCWSRAESGTPAETPFTMGKGLKEFQLCDSRRLRKKPQRKMRKMMSCTELFDLFDAHFWVGKVYRIWTPGPPRTLPLPKSQAHQLQFLFHHPSDFLTSRSPPSSHTKQDLALARDKHCSQASTWTHSPEKEKHKHDV